MPPNTPERYQTGEGCEQDQQQLHDTADQADDEGWRCPRLETLLLQLDAAKAQDPDTIDDADDDDAWTSLRPELKMYYGEVLGWTVDDIYADPN